MQTKIGMRATSTHDGMSVQLQLAGSMAYLQSTASSQLAQMNCMPSLYTCTDELHGIPSPEADTMPAYALITCHPTPS